MAIKQLGFFFVITQTAKIKAALWGGRKLFIIRWSYTNLEGMARAVAWHLY